MKQRDLLAAFFANVAQTSLTPMGITIESARGATLYAHGGGQYIDLLAGIGVAALGHGEPRVLAAIAEQAAKHLHVMVYGEFVQQAQVELAKTLAELLPDALQSVYFTNSGTEAVEGALKLARKATGRTRLLSFRGGFHGDTLGSVSVGGNPRFRDPFLPLLPDVGFLGFNDVASLDAIDSAVAAVIVEPVQAEAGVVLPDASFLPALRERCSRVGALLIFDEVLTGLARTGSMFALERYGVVPDVLVLAKALGGGLPLGAFVSSRRLMRTLAVDPPLAHVTTFGGHPLSCAAGLASLRILRDEGLAETAERRGAYLETLLRERLLPRYATTVRRAGLLVGIEMPEAAFVERFCAECLKEGVVMGWTLHDDRVVRLAPPLVITEAELEEAVLRMERAAARVATGRAAKAG